MCRSVVPFGCGFERTDKLPASNVAWLMCKRGCWNARRLFRIVCGVCRSRACSRERSSLWRSGLCEVRSGTFDGSAARWLLMAAVQLLLDGYCSTIQLLDGTATRWYSYSAIQLLDDSAAQLLSYSTPAARRLPRCQVEDGRPNARNPLTDAKRRREGCDAFRGASTGRLLKHCGTRRSEGRLIRGTVRFARLHCYVIAAGTRRRTALQSTRLSLSSLRPPTAAFGLFTFDRTRRLKVYRSAVRAIRLRFGVAWQSFGKRSRIARESLENHSRIAPKSLGNRSQARRCS